MGTINNMADTVMQNYEWYQWTDFRSIYAQHSWKEVVEELKNQPTWENRAAAIFNPELPTAYFTAIAADSCWKVRLLCASYEKTPEPVLKTLLTDPIYDVSLTAYMTMVENQLLPDFEHTRQLLSVTQDLQTLQTFGQLNITCLNIPLLQNKHLPENLAQVITNNIQTSKLSRLYTKDCQNQTIIWTDALKTLAI